MRIENLERVDAFTTKDGSEIRELAGIPTGNAEKQSLAEATVPPGAETEEHYHPPQALEHRHRLPEAPLLLRTAVLA